MCHLGCGGMAVVAVRCVAWYIASGGSRCGLCSFHNSSHQPLFCGALLLKAPYKPRWVYFTRTRGRGYKGASLVLQSKHPKNTENCDFGSRLQRIIGLYTTPTKRRGHHYRTMIAPQTRIGEVHGPSTRDNEFQVAIKCLLQSCQRELTNV